MILHRQDLADALSDYFVSSFLACKRNEIKRSGRYVTDWECCEYARHLRCPYGSGRHAILADKRRPVV
ncbi:MAG: glutamine synthetase [Actinomycetota bacterium]|nr:glutamine synthetase [Actinomycetota bacterium]